MKINQFRMLGSKDLAIRFYREDKNAAITPLMVEARNGKAVTRRRTTVLVREEDWDDLPGYPKAEAQSFKEILGQLSAIWEWAYNSMRIQGLRKADKLINLYQRELSIIEPHEYDRERLIERGAQLVERLDASALKEVEISVIVMKCRMDKTGSYPMMVLYTKGYERAYWKTGVMVFPTEWDFLRQTPREGSERYDELRLAQFDYLAEARIGLGFPTGLKELPDMGGLLKEEEALSRIERISREKETLRLIHEAAAARLLEKRTETHVLGKREEMKADLIQKREELDHVSWSFVLSKRCKDKEGRRAVCIKVKTGKKATSKNLKVYLKEEDWDTESGLPKMGCQGYKEAIYAIRKANMDARENVLKRKSSLEIGLGLSSDSEKKPPRWVGDYIRYLIRNLKAENLLGNASVYRTALHDLEEVMEETNVEFRWVDYQCLCRLEEIYRDRGISENSMSNRFRTIKAIWNKAIKDGVAEVEDYPFRRFQVGKFNTKTRHRATSKENIKRIMGYEPRLEDSKWMELARDVFIFSYLVGGVSFMDLCQLRESNITGSNIAYIRQKTHKRVRFVVCPEAFEIIEKYRPLSKGYLFPILRDGMEITVQQKRERCHRVLKLVNKMLRIMGKRLGLEKKLTTYVARHSFATVLHTECVDIDTIRECMGHEDCTTTSIYIDQFSVDKVSEAQDKLV